MEGSMSSLPLILPSLCLEVNEHQTYGGNGIGQARFWGFFACAEETMHVWIMGMGMNEREGTWR